MDPSGAGKASRAGGQRPTKRLASTASERYGTELSATHNNIQSKPLKVTRTTLNGGVISFAGSGSMPFCLDNQYQACLETDYTFTFSKTFKLKKVSDNYQKPCNHGGSCNIGDIGPGGGTVFYDGGSQVSGKKFLEVAPSGWNNLGSGEDVIWCDDIKMISTSEAIGSGRLNTESIANSCKWGAANDILKYRGAGLDDWFLPSSKEALQLITYFNKLLMGGIRGQLNSRYGYWSSSELTSASTCAKPCDYKRMAQAVVFNSRSPKLTWWQKSGIFVGARPVRAF
jgi:hypothetical protein